MLQRFMTSITLSAWRWSSLYGSVYICSFNPKKSAKHSIWSKEWCRWLC